MLSSLKVSILSEIKEAWLATGASGGAYEAVAVASDLGREVNSVLQETSHTAILSLSIRWGARFAWA
jgi:hypothetical protein